MKLYSANVVDLMLIDLPGITKVNYSKGKINSMHFLEPCWRLATGY